MTKLSCESHKTKSHGLWVEYAFLETNNSPSLSMISFVLDLMSRLLGGQTLAAACKKRSAAQQIVDPQASTDCTDKRRGDIEIATVGPTRDVLSHFATLLGSLD
jgi:hypothetical protein